MPKPGNVEVGRIAFRQEGSYINCYFAAPDTMKDAVHIASVLRSACERDDRVFAAFKALGQLIVSATMKQAIGREPDEFHDQPAPEHERSGRA